MPAPDLARPSAPASEPDPVQARRQVWIAAGVAALLVLIGLWLRFDYPLDPYLPAMPPKPKAPRDAKATLRGLDYKPEVFRAALENDADHYGIARSTLEQFTWPFPYELVDSPTPLPPGATPYETRTLRLSTRVTKAYANTQNGSYSIEHLVLRIENLTDKPLAYRVDTQARASGGRCLDKGDLPHNALALRPHEVIERTECVWPKKMDFVITKVETLTIPQLSYQYVSRLEPSTIGLDARSTRAHRSADGQVCRGIDGQAIHLALQKGQATWRDVVDFHARHNCDKYLFPIGYRAFTRRDEYVLPVSAN